MKKSKLSTAQYLLSGATILFCLLLILPLFISMIDLTALNQVTGSYNIFELKDIILSAQDVSGLGTAIEIAGLIAIISGIVLALLEILRLLKIKLPRLLRFVLSILVVVASITAFVMLCVMASSASSEALSEVTKYVVSAGGYLLFIFGLLGGLSGIIANRK